MIPLQPAQSRGKDGSLSEGQEMWQGPLVLRSACVSLSFLGIVAVDAIIAEGSGAICTPL